MILRSIGRSGVRSFFTATGVALAILLVLATIGMLSSLRHLMDVEFDDVTLYDGNAQYAAPVTDADLKRVRDVPGVTDVESAVVENVSVRHGSDVYATTLTGFDKDTSMHGFMDESGAPVALSSDGVVLDESITTQLPGVAVGDTVSVTFGDHDGTVVTAPVTAFAYEPLGAFVYTDKDWLKDALPEAAPMAVLLKTEEAVNPDEIRQFVSDQPGVLIYVDTAAVEATVTQWSALMNAIAVFMLVLGAIMAFAVIFTTMSVSIVERSREIATMRAAGVRFATIASMVRWENLIVSLFGVIPGAILGLLASASFVRTLSSDEFSIPLYVPVSAVVWVVGAILLVALASQIPGMLRVRHMNVADVVRERAA
jgi:putative ABC transport system permease protein